MMSKNNPLVLNIGDDVPIEIDSLCMKCHGQGKTIMLLTRIPHFKELMVACFHCNDNECGYKENKLTNIGDIQSFGVEITLKVASSSDLNRQVVLTEHTVVDIKGPNDCELNIPGGKSLVTTVEGILSMVIEDLEQEQPIRQRVDAANHAKIAVFLDKLADLRKGDSAFTITLHDITGNCHLENPGAPRPDAKMKRAEFSRTFEENKKVGMYDDDATQADEMQKDSFKQDAMAFQDFCPSCKSPAEIRMSCVDIPHFKEVVLMCMTCEKCGHKDSEIKTGGKIENKGSRTIVDMTVREDGVLNYSSDLQRDVIVSSTASIVIPELDFSTENGSHGGSLTTVEGILKKIQEKLSGQTSFATGDGAAPGSGSALRSFVDDLTAVIQGNKPVTFIIDDPAGNSYIQNYFAPDDDHTGRYRKELYDRTAADDNILGIAEMKTEDY